MSPIREALEQTGINTSTLDRIRLARGVVGKASYVAAAAIVVLSGIAWSLHDPAYLVIAAGLVVFVFVLYFVGILWFANRHPGVALLEGAELIQWRQMDIAGKSASQFEAPVEAPVLRKPETDSGD